MDPSNSASASRAPRPARPADLLDILSSGEPPAFANDERHRIIFWNKGAERVLGRTAAQALGRLCHDVICGRDLFENKYCGQTCGVTTSLARREPMRRFEMGVGEAHRRQMVGFTILEYPGSTPGGFAAVHILDEVTQGDLLAEIERLRRRAESTVTPRLTIRRPKSTEPAPPESTLSAREKQILRLIAEGRSGKEIAEDLHISLATARNHTQRILRKLGVHSKLEATALAFQRGWVGPGAV